MENASTVTSILLTAFYEMDDLKYLYFTVFLLVYIAIVLQNIILICVIYFDRSLHEPMYVFVCNLALNGLLGSTALLPAFLVNLLSKTHEVSLSHCQAQLFCLHTYAITEFTILAMMGYDRYVAICYPLQYHSIMSVSKVYKFIILSWILPIIAFTLFFIRTLQLTLCGKTIDKAYCSNYSLVKLSCADTTVSNIVGLLSLIVYSFPQLLLLLYSYAQILRVCIHTSKASQIKALKTCTPHLLAILNYCIGCFSEMCRGRLDMKHVDFGTRIFMSLYFLICPPVLNPVLYGMSIQAIRLRILKLFKFKSKKTLMTHVVRNK